VKTCINRLDTPPVDTPQIPSQGVWFASITPGTDAASRAVDHVSNVEYVRWLDQCGQQHLASLGWASDSLIASGAMWFVARHEIDYRLEARAGESLVLATWVRDVRRVKSWRDTMVWRVTTAGPETVCTASTLWVHVDLERRRGVSPPADMVHALLPGGPHPAPTWRDRR